MILLSRIYERLGRVLELQEEMLAMQRRDVPAKAPKKPTEAFSYYIKDRRTEESLLAYLHTHIDVLNRVDAYIYLQAAIDAGVLSRPPFNTAAAEFPGHLGSVSTYNQYVGDSSQFSTKRRMVDLEQAIDEIKQLLK